MRVLGVDPGLDGALGLVETGLDTVLARDMPVAGSGVNQRREVVPALLAEIVREWRPDFAWVERVHAMPRQGVASVFTFGQGYGVVLGVLAALDVPTRLVRPPEWKRWAGLGTDKAGARAMAARQWPKDASLFARARDDGRAEAVLIGWFGAHHAPMAGAHHAPMA